MVQNKWHAVEIKQYSFKTSMQVTKYTENINVLRRSNNEIKIKKSNITNVFTGQSGPVNK